MEQPRCGNHDGDFESEDSEFVQNLRRRKRRSVGGNRWESHKLSFDVQNSPYTLSQNQVRRAFRKALGKIFTMTFRDLFQILRHRFPFLMDSKRPEHGLILPKMSGNRSVKGSFGEFSFKIIQVHMKNIVTRVKIWY